MKRKTSHGISAADKRIILILAIFSVCVLGMVGVTYLTIDTMAAVRSYGSLKDNWRYLRMNATENLGAYIRTQNSDYYDVCINDIDILHQYSLARKELVKPNYNYDFVINAFSIQQNDLSAINDIPTMIRLFRRVHGSPMMRNIITLWSKGDENVHELDTLATAIHADIQSGKADKARLSNATQSITLLNYRFSDLHDVMNITSNETYEWIKQVILLITLSIGFMLLLIGGVSTTIVLRSSYEMRMAIEENEQRFRSLFENNPNAAFLKDLNGRIINLNNAAVKLTGYSSNELKNMKLEEITVPKDRSLVEENFSLAAKGTSHHIDVECLSRSGKRFTIELTHIPIYMNGKCTGVFAVAEDITARIVQDKKIRDSLREKEVLLSEIHHRVKNNLALISGLLDLQIQYVKEPVLADVLKNTQLRIYSMAKVHELLYKETFFTHIDMKTYLHNLSKIISDTFSNSRSGIKLTIKAEDLRLNINTAIPLGLILNELITNAYKHAFAEETSGNLFINLENNGDYFNLSVLTDGIKLPENFDPDDFESLGMTLIRTLAIQIEAQLDVIHDKYDGFMVRFKPKKI